MSIITILCIIYISPFSSISIALVSIFLTLEGSASLILRCLALLRCWGHPHALPHLFLPSPLSFIIVFFAANTAECLVHAWLLFCEQHRYWKLPVWILYLAIVFISRGHRHCWEWVEGWAECDHHPHGLAYTQVLCLWTEEFSGASQKCPGTRWCFKRNSVTFLHV